MASNDQNDSQVGTTTIWASKNLFKTIRTILFERKIVHNFTSPVHTCQVQVADQQVKSKSHTLKSQVTNSLKSCPSP